ncbi:DinB family protein [Roseovarius salis]|uniref:DinB family protein n=1 Tax=Roseovarius salis TaxID=3376063 RepID=UPI0037C5E1BE
MITPEYCRLMARYNAWQNRQLARLLRDVPLDDLKADQGAFFGSILGTLNHVLWADRMWMSRFDAGFAKPEGGIRESVDLCPTLGVWDAERFAMDGSIAAWADRLGAIRLSGDLSWHSAASGRDQSKPLALCVVHMFNHQTHHRGQVHAMMTRAGLEAPVTDLFLMPEDDT